MAETFCPMADTRYPLQWHRAVTGPFCSFSYSILNLFLVRGWPGSGTTSITSRSKIWTQESNPHVHFLFSSSRTKRRAGVAASQCAAHSAPAGDLLPLHQAGPCCDVALQPRHGLLTPQRYGLHTGHMFPLLQVDPYDKREGTGY